MGTSTSSPAFEPAVDDDGHGDENGSFDEKCCLPLGQPLSPPRAPPTSTSIPSLPPPSPVTSPPRTQLPKPKKLLWGCTNAEEHYEYIINACKRVEGMHGDEGLRELGLEYQMVHNPLTCQCDNVELEDMMVNCNNNQLNTYDELDPSHWEEEEVGNEPEHVDMSVEEQYMVPIGSPLVDVGAAATSITGELRQDGSSTNTDTSCGPSCSHPQDLVSSKEDIEEYATLPTSPSNVSLFSLATHHTWSSLEDRDGTEFDHECALRLVHVPPPSVDRPPTLIEADNYETFIANGRMYDEVSRLCSEYAQTIMLEEGDMSWITICEERGIRAMVTKDRVADQAAGRTRSKKILLIVTGKGKVRAGIFSRRHILTTGIEASSALPMVREAKRRDIDVVILDPNANGDANGMDTVDTSLRHLFPHFNEGEEDVFVIAHSMAGAQIVRYLLGDKQVGRAANGDKGVTNEEQVLLRTIKAIAFTDSNHNINWTRKTNPKLTEMLVGPSCLYIKAHKIHQDDPKELGALHHECEFWRHRFGNIRTIWAGTHEHALTNYTARHYIWDHFDTFIEYYTDADDNESGGDKVLSF